MSKSLTLSVASVVLALGLIASFLQPALAIGSQVSVFARTIVNYKTQQLDVDSIETVMEHPVFTLPDVDYDQILQELQDQLDQVKNTLKFPCDVCETPLVVHMEDKIKWLSKSGLNAKVVPPATANKLHLTSSARLQVRLTLSAADGISGIADFSAVAHIFLVADIALSADLQLFPVVQISNPKVDITPVTNTQDFDIDIDRNDGIIVAAYLTLDPILIAAVEAAPGILTGLAKDFVKKKIDQILTDSINQAKQKALQKVKDLAKSANDVEQKLLTTPIGSYGTLQHFLLPGVSLDVRTAASQGHPDFVNTVATIRLDPQPGSSKLTLHFTIPATSCNYLCTHGACISIGIIQVNQDVVGLACKNIISTSDITVQMFLGANPEDTLNSGNSANKMQVWRTMGTKTVTASKTQTAQSIGCTVEVTNLPLFGIARVMVDGDLGKRVGDHLTEYRVEIAPGSSPSQKIGHTGPVTNKDCPPYGSFQMNAGGQPQQWFQNCPMCGPIRIKQTDDGILVMNPWNLQRVVASYKDAYPSKAASIPTAIANIANVNLKTFAPARTTVVANNNSPLTLNPAAAKLTTATTTTTPNVVTTPQANKALNP